MSEQSSIAPNTLGLGYGQLVTERVTDVQFGSMRKNMERYGVDSALSRMCGAIALERQWDAFNLITDEIAGLPIVERGPEERPDHLRVTIDFESGRGRLHFHTLLLTMLAGIHNGDEGLPYYDFEENNDKRLTIINFPYADLATMGRGAEAYMRAQEGPQRRKRKAPESEERDDVALRLNMRHVLQHSIGYINQCGVRTYLSPNIGTRIDQLEASMGQDVAARMLLSSGRLGLIGESMRAAMRQGEDRLPIKLHRGRNRPNIEKGVYLLCDRITEPAELKNKDGSPASLETMDVDEGIPISQATIGKVIKGQLKDRWDEAKVAFEERAWHKLGQELVDFFGFFIAQGVGTGLRLAGTMASSAIPAAWRKIHENTLRRKLGKK